MMDPGTLASGGTAIGAGAYFATTIVRNLGEMAREHMYGRDLKRRIEERNARRNQNLNPVQFKDQ